MSDVATVPITRERTCLPWTQRIAQTPPWSPWRLAVAIAVGLLAAFLGVELALDRVPLLLGQIQNGTTRDAQLNARIALIQVLLVAYLPAAFADGARGARAAVASILPSLDAGPAELAALRDEAGRYDAGRMRIAGWIGIGVAILIPFWIDRNLAAWEVWRKAVEPILQRALLLPTGWLGARFLYAVTVESRRLSRAGALARVDLLDLRTFAPLTRQGMRYALIVLGLLSILVLYGYDYDKPGLMGVVATAGALALGAAAAALLLPLRGAHAAIRAAKHAELAWCDAELRRARAALGGGGASTRSLADVAAWRNLVSAVPEWPLDAPTLQRFLLYLAIPLGSWLGGALVEHIVDLVLR